LGPLRKRLSSTCHGNNALLTYPTDLAAITHEKLAKSNLVDTLRQFIVGRRNPLGSSFKGFCLRQLGRLQPDTLSPRHLKIDATQSKCTPPEVDSAAIDSANNVSHLISIVRDFRNRWSSDCRRELKWFNCFDKS
jgi:hypothetical protein